MMLELLLGIYVAIVIAATYVTLKHYGLLFKHPTVQIEEKTAIMEKVMRALQGMLCPLCGSKETCIERLDLWKENMAVLKCNSCGEKSLWKLEAGNWHLIAPYKFTPSMFLPKPEPPKQFKKQLEKEHIEKKEGIKLEF